jgi:hypothetical protein
VPLPDRWTRRFGADAGLRLHRIRRAPVLVGWPIEGARSGARMSASAEQDSPLRTRQLAGGFGLTGKEQDRKGWFRRQQQSQSHSDSAKRLAHVDRRDRHLDESERDFRPKHESSAAIPLLPSVMALSGRSSVQTTGASTNPDVAPSRCPPHESERIDRPRLRAGEGQRGRAGSGQG